MCVVCSVLAAHLHAVPQAVTEYHLLLLYPTRLLVLNAVSRALVQDIALAGRGAPGFAGQPLSLITDTATAAVYLATSEAPLQQVLAPKFSGRALHIRWHMKWPYQHPHVTEEM